MLLTKFIEKRFIEETKELTLVGLDKHLIEVIHSKAFKKSVLGLGVQKLNMSSNNLLEIPTFLSDFNDLKELNVSGNRIHELPEFLQDLPLTSLDMAMNSLCSIPYWVANMSSLVDLNLQNNFILSFPAVLNNSSVKNLCLNNNNLCAVPELESFNFVKLDLANNFLKISPVFSTNSSLEFLSLFGNSLTSLDKSLLMLTNLKTLDVHSNNLVRKVEFLDELTNLQTLNLSHNKLTDLSLCNVSNTLYNLYIAGNPLLTFPDIPPNVNALYVDERQMHLLSKKDTVMPNLKKLVISGITKEFLFTFSKTPNLTTFYLLAEDNTFVKVQIPYLKYNKDLLDEPVLLSLDKDALENALSNLV